MSIPRDLLLLPSEINWFGDRITESHSGRVLIPSHCYTKFRRIIGDEFLTNIEVKCWLIDNIYNKIKLTNQ